MTGFYEYLPILILVFITAACIAAAVILNIHSRKSLINKKEKDFIDNFIEKKKRKLNANIGGLTWSTYLTILFAAPLIFGGISYLLLPNKAFCIVFAFIGLFIPEIVIRITDRKQKKAFEEKFARALRALASSLRSGLSIEQSIDEVGRNPFVDEHIREGFRQIASDIKVGISLEDAFRQFTVETGSPDAADVASAISMQAKVGGSEAKVISTIAQNINDRLMLRKEIRALFADTSILIIAMDIMPWLMFVIMYFGAPQMIKPFFESFGMTMALIGILAFSTIGSFVIRKIVSTAKEG